MPGAMQANGAAKNSPVSAIAGTEQDCSDDDHQDEDQDQHGLDEILNRHHSDASLTRNRRNRRAKPPCRGDRCR